MAKLPKYICFTTKTQIVDGRIEVSLDPVPPEEVARSLGPAPTDRPVTLIDIDGIGRRIRAARKTRGLRQNDLAQRLDVPQQMIGGWETGRRVPKASSINRLVEVLGCSAEYLLGLAEKERDL